MIWSGINKIEVIPGSSISYFASSDYDPKKGIIYTAASHRDFILIYQFNISNGDNINSKYKTPPSVTVPYTTYIHEDKVYIILVTLQGLAFSKH